MYSEKIFFVILLIFSLTTVLLINCHKALYESSSDSWHFIAIGDTRNWGENDSNPIRSAIINSIVDNNPNLEFILHSGDMVNQGAEQDDWDRYYEDIENATKKGVKFYYAIGNHELYTYKLPDGRYGPLETNFSTYLKNVELPGNERYYSFDFNDQIHFIMINTDENWEGGDTGTFYITPEQKSWIEDDLGENTIDFVIAMFHRPCYSIRRPSRVLAAQEIRRVLEPILTQFDVDLVFSGHDHYYYRTKRRNIVHVITGGGGAPLAVNDDTSEWIEDDKFFSEYHYCNITVKQLDGNLIVKIDMLIFDETNKTTRKGDSFEINPQLEETTTTKAEVTTGKSTAFNTFIIAIAGIIFIVFFLRMRKT